MSAFILRRLAATVPVLIGVTVIAFALSLALPGGPAAASLGVKATQEQIDAERRRLGLDASVHVQYVRFWSGLLAGRIRSYQSGRPVTELIGRALPVTFLITLGAMIIAILLGLVLGFGAAARPGGLADGAAMGAATLGLSVPVFWWAMILVAIFSVWLGWFPPSLYERGSFRHLVLPSIALGTIFAAAIARLTRASVIDAMHEPYVRAARARGAGGARVLVAHAGANAMLPVVTVIGTNFAGLLTGAVLTETVFSLPGLGQLMYNAIDAQDYNLLMAAIATAALVFVLVNLVVDVAYAWLDPRIRYA